MNRFMLWLRQWWRWQMHGEAHCSTCQQRDAMAAQRRIWPNRF